ncbi:MFS transporter [uncultured Arsenicicoccus sp.]|uniref:MFS transporter n=1 Tax=uncultured Arsenicicoccus sp. TaxID=491339 RepID=UPI00259963DB|nr:nitrate/nitrite transporter [uncultured Arsenicicoccus sp.]
MSSTTSSTSTSAAGAPASAAGTSTTYTPSPGELAPGLTRASGRTLMGWDPESAGQWDHGGRTIARRNLALSVFAEFLGFAVWAVWSIVVPQLPRAGFTLTVDQMFWLVSVPSLVGATLRVPYTFAVPAFGGRTWTTISALLLLLPTLGLAWAVQHPETPFGVLLLIAALAGVGGGNFSSSMANISFFYPEREKGAALGLNAAGGNLGTAAVQLAVPLVIVTASGVALDRAGLMFIPLVLVAAVLAWRCMDNIAGTRSDRRSYARAARHPHTWLLSVIYIGTFGSFIGYSGAFPTLLKAQFPEMSLNLAFLGALVGSLSRPLGGRLADRFGGATITCISFVVMAIGAVGAVMGLRAHSFALFFGAFLLLFVVSGLGNGSVYRMIPAVFTATSEGGADALLRAKKAAAGCIGIAGAVGAFGGFLIPRGFALSTSLTGSLQAALWAFVCAYLLLLGVTWAVYLRRGSSVAAHRI